MVWETYGCFPSTGCVHLFQGHIKPIIVVRAIEVVIKQLAKGVSFDEILDLAADVFFFFL